MPSLPHLSMPLVTRELHSYARSTSAYWLRVLVVLALCAPAILFGFSGVSLFTGGKELFCMLAVILCFSLSLLGPLISAGCITSEKEGGTLVLLFLSPLNSFDIVAGKWISNFLRLFSIALAGLPVLASSFMFGGVTWEQLAAVWLVLVSVVILMVSAAVLASALGSRTQVAMILAFFLTLTLQLGLPWLWAYLKFERGYPLPEKCFLVSPAVSLGYLFSSRTSNVLATAGQAFGIACAEGVFFLTLAAWWLPRTLTSVDSRFPMWWWRMRRVRLLPSWRAWNARLRDRNPLLWLEYRRPLLGSGIFSLVILGGGLYLVRDANPNVTAWVSVASLAHIVIGALILGNVGREVCRERSQRTLESLLCTPLDERDILWSKFKGMWLRYGSVYLAASAPTVFCLLCEAEMKTSWRTAWQDPFTSPIASPCLTLLLLGVGGIGYTLRKKGASLLRSLACGAILMGVLSGMIFGMVNWRLRDGSCWALNETIEDIPFVCMLFAVSFRTALFSRSVTNAVLKAFGWIAGALVVWGMVTIMSMASLAIRSSMVGASSRPEQVINLMVGLKIFIEVVVFMVLMRSLPGQLRAQCGVSVDSG